MSGRKVSRYELERRAALKVERINGLQDCQQQRTALGGHARQALAQAAPGLKHTFSTQVSRTEAWLEETSREYAQPSSQWAIERLESEWKTQHEQVEQGKEILSGLLSAFTSQASELGQVMGARLAAYETRFIGREDLIRLWFGEQETTRISAAAAQLSSLLAEQNYRTLEEQLQAAEADLESLIAQAETLETSHQHRTYLLRSLAQVCDEMGFRETRPAAFEQPDQRGSAIIYEVDTFNQGKITFYLTLEGIQSDAESSLDHCMVSFEQLSEKLHEEYDVKTEFKLASGAAPILKTNTAKLLPQQKKGTTSIP
jgi:hypothetical protein